MMSTDTFFAEVEKAIAACTAADRPRLEAMLIELQRIAAETPQIAPRCYACQARLYSKMHLFEQALTAVDQALELMPLDDSLLLLRSDINRERTAYIQALQDYNRPSDSLPDSVSTHMRRADLRQAKGEHLEALQDINEAIKHEPHSLHLLYRRGLILVELGRLAEAIQDFETVAATSADSELRQKAEQRLNELGRR